MKRSIPRRDAWPEDLQIQAYDFLTSLSDAPSLVDLEALEGVSSTSTTAEIGAAIAAYVAKVKQG